MDGIALKPLDIALVAAYLVGIAALGLWFSRGVRTGKDLFLGGKSLPWWAVGTSLVVSDIGAKDMVGLAGDGYRYGLVMTNFDFIGCVFPVLIAAFVFMPYFWMAGVYTVPEYLGRRYNIYVRTFFALIWALFMVGTLGVIFVSASTMFEGLLGEDFWAQRLGWDFLSGWDFWIGVTATAALVGLYTAVGGLKAVVVTDFISCIVLIGGAALICGFGLAETGGWSGLQET
ncbi:MAG: sodium:solute symporter family transporter, partial [Pirellulales bacterium]